MKQLGMFFVSAVLATFAAGAAEFPVVGPWRVDFPARGWVPASVTMPKLLAWKDAFDDSRKYHSGAARYFSGKGVYHARFVWRDLPEGAVRLELGRVCDKVLKVTLNGTCLEVSKTAPFTAEARSALVEGINELVVEVESSPFNAKVYQAATLYGRDRKAGEAYPDPSAPLEDNGLMGPVKFVYDR